MMKIRNYVSEASCAYYNRENRREEELTAYQCCSTQFPMIHILNIAANTEAIKAIDILEERGMRRQALKKMLNLYEARYDEYTNYIRKNLKRDVWPLLQDYARVACKNIEGKTNGMRQACYNYLKKKGVAEASLLAQCEVGMLMWQIATDTFRVYFERYFEECGIDYSNDFKYADLTICKDRWIKITDELSKGVRGIDFNDDKRCRDAWNDLKEAMNTTDFFDRAAAEAIRLNPGLKEKYIDKV